jgi:hypothetical protein
MSLSTTAGHVPRSALKLLRAQTTTYVSEPEPHNQAAPEYHIQENKDTHVRGYNENYPVPGDNYYGY